MTVLVTGANGQLGTEMRIVSAGSPDRYVFTDVDELDITDRSAVLDFVRREKVEAIVNCAAYTNVDAAEDNAVLAARINAEAPGYLAEAMAAAGGLLVHISTDYVFGAGSPNTPCTEDMQTGPLGVYGQTKLDGEKAVLASGCSSIIIRTAWMYSEYGRNFLKTMLALTSTRPQVKVVFDQVGTPTYALGLASVISGILDRRLWHGKEGIYNYTDEGVCSWFDFARAIAELSGVDPAVVQPCHSSEFPSKVHRPPYSVLDKSKIKSTFGVSVPYWTDSLKECLANMKQQI